MCINMVYKMMLIIYVCRDFDVSINKWIENDRIKELNICLIYGV